MKVKSRGPCVKVAAFVCAAIELWQSSLSFITPGKDKDPWWDGEQTQEQAKRHLLEVDAWIAETGGNKAALDIIAWRKTH